MMKVSFLVFSALFILSACDNNTKIKGVASDAQKATPAVVAKPAAPAPVGPSSVIDAEPENTAKAKTGWSKTAKGAVIGGVVGAGTGAVINKRNRAAGAVVGGVAGAGAGAIIGNELDKKDGRH